MGEEMVEILNLISGPNRLERMRILLEIRVNRLLFGHKPSAGMAFTEFLTQLKDSKLLDWLKPGGEAEEAVICIRSNFQKVMAEENKPPFPTYYNADKSLALLCYALTRYLRPEVVLETGVGYGITSALVLFALERNECGKLISVDLPPLADPYGLSTGLAVPEYLRKRWTLYSGSSRRRLPKVLKGTGNIELFISDSANVHTLQRYEFETAWPRLSPGGAAIFNNISHKFQRFLKSVDNAQSYSIWQMEKPSCVTGLLLKR